MQCSVVRQEKLPPCHLTPADRPPYDFCVTHMRLYDILVGGTPLSSKEHGDRETVDGHIWRITWTNLQDIVLGIMVGGPTIFARFAKLTLYYTRRI